MVETNFKLSLVENLVLSLLCPLEWTLPPEVTMELNAFNIELQVIWPIDLGSRGINSKHNTTWTFDFTLFSY